MIMVLLYNLIVKTKSRNKIKGRKKKKYMTENAYAYYNFISPSQQHPAKRY